MEEDYPLTERVGDGPEGVISNRKRPRNFGYFGLSDGERQLAERQKSKSAGIDDLRKIREASIQKQNDELAAKVKSAALYTTITGLAAAGIVAVTYFSATYGPAIGELLYDAFH